MFPINDGERPTYAVEAVGFGTATAYGLYRKAAEQVAAKRCRADAMVAACRLMSLALSPTTT